MLPRRRTPLKHGRVAPMVPTYASERRLITEQGLEAFWQREWDPYDVARPPVC